MWSNRTFECNYQNFESMFLIKQFANGFYCLAAWWRDMGRVKVIYANPIRSATVKKHYAYPVISVTVNTIYTHSLMSLIVQIFYAHPVLSVTV